MHQTATSAGIGETMFSIALFEIFAGTIVHRIIASMATRGDRHLRRLGTAPPVPAPFVPRDAAEKGESRRGGDTEARRTPDAVDHDEDGVGNVVLRDGDAAAATGRDGMRRAAAERVQRHGGRAPVLRPQAKPRGDKRGGRVRTVCSRGAHWIDMYPPRHGLLRR